MLPVAACAVRLRVIISIPSSDSLSESSVATRTWSDMAHIPMKKSPPFPGWTSVVKNNASFDFNGCVMLEKSRKWGGMLIIRFLMFTAQFWH